MAQTLVPGDVAPAAPPVDDFDPAAWKRQYSALDQVGALRRNASGEAEHVTPADMATTSWTGDGVPAAAPQDAAVAAPLDRPSSSGGLEAAEPPESEPADASPPVGAVQVDLSDDEQTINERNDVSFVRQARRQAFWRSPAVRLAAGVASLVLLAALLVQVAFHQRDAIAASQPQLRPALQAMCARLGCEIGQLRRIESVVIDSSTFNRIGTDAYRLGFTLKNSGTYPLAMPSLEVTLTDTQERALVRRVLMPAQFGAGNRPLLPGADFSGSVAMQVTPGDGESAAGPLRVTGYRVLAFYP